MIGTMVGIIGLCAVGAWAVAAYSALQTILLAPKGDGFAVCQDLGAWRHAEIMRKVPAAAPHLARFRKAFGAFFLCIVAGMVLAMFAAFAENRGKPQ